MPRIHDDILQCSIYLYPSVEDAQKGEAAGGSGFIVGIRSEVEPERAYSYAVTNWHVVNEGSSIVRVNTQDGGMDTIALTKSDWIHHSGGDDLAVCPVILPETIYRAHLVGIHQFITIEMVTEYGIGIGDEVFVIGRFVTREGKQRNIPTARFGAIAQMNEEPIWHEYGFQQEAFLAEVRSISGFSGSPVFVHIPPWSWRPDRDPTSKGYGQWLLGVDFCHLASPEWVRDPQSIAGKRLDNGGYVNSNTGLMGVIPAWKLHDLLMEEPLVEARERNEQMLRERNKDAGNVMDNSTGDSLTNTS